MRVPMKCQPPLLLVLMLAVLAMGGCDRGDPTVRAWGKEPAKPTPEELVLIDQITRDPFVQVAGLQRDSEGRLLVTTTQGPKTVHYMLAPITDGGNTLVIRLVGEDMELMTSIEPGKGTGPEPRGLHR